MNHLVVYLRLVYYCKSTILQLEKNVLQLSVGEGNGTPLQYSCLENPMDSGAWWAAVHGVAKGRTRLSNFTFTFHFLALEKEMASHSSVLAWRIPGTEEPGGLPSMGSHRVGHDWSDLAAAAFSLDLFFFFLIKYLVLGSQQNWEEGTEMSLMSPPHTHAWPVPLPASLTKMTCLLPRMDIHRHIKTTQSP